LLHKVHRSSSAIDCANGTYLPKTHQRTPMSAATGPTAADFKSANFRERNWPLPLFCRTFSGLCRKPLIDPFLHSAKMKSVSIARGSTV
jgi:hypothetical protein